MTFFFAFLWYHCEIVVNISILNYLNVDESVGVDHGAHEANQQRLGGKGVGVYDHVGGVRVG